MSAKSWIIIAALAALAFAIPEGWASVMTGSCKPVCRTSVNREFVQGSMGEHAILRRNDASQRLRGGEVAENRGAGNSIPPLRLTGTLSGDWDRVEGFVTFPRTYEEDDIGRLELLLRGFSTVPGAATGVYVVPAWDRNLFFIDPDTTNAAEIPRVLATVEREPAYQPMPDDDYAIFRDDEYVLAECTGSNFCSIQVVDYAELQEEGRDYSDYPEGAAPVIVYLVVNDAGTLVSAAADIFDENGEYERTDFLYIGDTIEFFMQALDVDQPEFLFLIEYMTPRELTDNFTLERTYYIPGQDYVDPDLPPDFDAAVQPIQFLLEGARAGVGGNPDVFEQAGPWDLGFQWQDLLDFVFKSNFEAPTPDHTPGTRNSLARPDPESAGR